MDNNFMDNSFRKFFTDEEIERLDPDELEKIAGGAVTNEVKCPICKQKIAIRSIKEHLKTAHGKNS